MPLTLGSRIIVGIGCHYPNAGSYNTNDKKSRYPNRTDNETPVFCI